MRMVAPPHRTAEIARVQRHDSRCHEVVHRLVTLVSHSAGAERAFAHALAHFSRRT
jgi:hypothetical protein